MKESRLRTRPAIFKWRQSEPSLILCAVRWYLHYSLSLRDVEELLEERGLNLDHTTTWRWVQCYGPELEQRLRPHLTPTNKSWRVDETYVRVKGRWCYLYRVIDPRGAIERLMRPVCSGDMWANVPAMISGGAGVVHNAGRSLLPCCWRTKKLIHSADGGGGVGSAVAPRPRRIGCKLPE